MSEPTPGEPLQQDDPSGPAHAGATGDQGTAPADRPVRQFSSSTPPRKPGSKGDHGPGPSVTQPAAERHREHLFDPDNAKIAHRDHLFEAEPEHRSAASRGHLFHEPDPHSGVNTEVHYGLASGTESLGAPHQDTAPPTPSHPGASRPGFRHPEDAQSGTTSPTSDQPVVGSSGMPAPGARVVDGTQPNPGGEAWGHDALEIEKHGGTWVKPLDHVPSGHTGEHQAVSAALAGTMGTAAAGTKSRPSAEKRTGPKPIRGPRFSGSPFVAGLGILSLLIVIAIMAFLAVKILTGVEEGTSSKGGAAGVLAPDLQMPDAGGMSGGAATANVNAAACAADKDAIQTAIEAYTVMNGSSPASIADLVTAGLLSVNPGTFNLEPSADGVTMVGIGKCEGVN